MSDVTNHSFTTAIELLTIKQPHESSNAVLMDSICELQVTEESPAITYPDGGVAAWCVVFASFVAHIAIYGQIWSFGVYQSYYEAQGTGSSSQIAFIGSISATLVDGLGIVASGVADRFGFKVTIFTGALILTLGLLLASFTTSLPYLLMTQGILFGLGGALVYFPALGLPSQWFDKRRGIATGLAVAGSGVGGLGFAMLTARLLDSVGFSWTLRVNALLTFAMLCAVLPFCNARLPPATAKSDYSVIKDGRFICLTIAVCVANFSIFVPVDFVGVYGQQRLDLPLSSGALLISLYNGFSIAGRILMGLFADFLGANNALLLAMWITVVANFSWLACTSFASLAAYSSISGFFGGAFWSLLPVVAAGMFGSTSSLVTTVAILYSVLAFGNFGSPPLTGFIKDNAGLDWMIFYAAFTALFAAIFATVSYFLHLRVLADKKKA